MSTENEPLVSIVVTTRNEERNIANCLRSIQSQTWKRIEAIVVDNGSTDRTKAIALEYTPHVFDKGPERSAQRNYGIIQNSSGEYAMFIDADMLLTPSTVEKCIEAMQQSNVTGLHVQEIVLGRGFLAKVRRYERSFYSGTVVDGIRFFRRDLFVALGGFDEKLPPGPEDWDLDKRFKQRGSLVLIPETGGDVNNELQAFVSQRGIRPHPDYVGIYHNEDEQTLRRYLSKKGYYSNSMSAYTTKWGADDPDIRKQLGLSYRFFVVFVEHGKFRKILRYPHLFIAMLGLRLLVGATFLLTKRTSRG